MNDGSGGSSAFVPGELDLALERFQRTAPEWGGGLANHGPMACEALVALGHEALVPGFVERYAPRLPPLARGTSIPPRDRPSALGRAERTADWVATWEAELAARAWREVLAESVPTLLPGLFASAGHGLLRTAHAARALAAGDTPVRRRELAHGLALWCARFQRLPGEPGRRGAGAPPRLSDLEPVPSEARRGGLFTRQVEVLEVHPAFAAWVDALPTGAGARGAARRLASEAAALFLEHPHARIAYVHAVTVPAALGLVAPYLPASARGEAEARALQAAGALHAVSHGPRAPDAGERAEAERAAGDPAEIRYRAACSLDEHAIKMAEACLREDAEAAGASHAALRLAAADAALHQGGAQRSC